MQAVGGMASEALSSGGGLDLFGGGQKKLQQYDPGAVASGLGGPQGGAVEGGDGAAPNGSAEGSPSVPAEGVPEPGADAPDPRRAGLMDLIKAKGQGALNDMVRGAVPKAGPGNVGVPEMSQLNQIAQMPMMQMNTGTLPPELMQMLRQRGVL